MNEATDNSTPRRPRRRRGRGGSAPRPVMPSLATEMSTVSVPANVSNTNPPPPLVNEVREAAAGLLTRDRDQYVLRMKAGSRDGWWVPPHLVTRNNLRLGDLVEGQAHPPRPGQRYPGLVEVEKINGTPLAQMGKRRNFDDLTSVYPNRMLKCETTAEETIGRMVDLFSPIGAGQRALIVAPPKAGKTTVLKRIANAISKNDKNAAIIVVLVGERPEEVTDIVRTVPGELYSSSFDDDAAVQTAVAEFAIERAKRLAEAGRDVVVILDSLTRLAQAYNRSVRSSGRTLSGGLDPAAAVPPRKFLGAARNFDEGGSLTIVASCLINTGSKLDDMIYEEFKGTGNMELILDRDLAERRVFPAINIQKSGTRQEELLMSKDELDGVTQLRKMVASLNGEATEKVLDRLSKTKTNAEFVDTVMGAVKRAKASKEAAA